MYLYKAVSESLLSEECGTYVSYGITLTCDGEVIDHISDVTCDGDMAHALAELLTHHQLSHLHFHDVIEDFLFDGTLDLRHREDLH